MVVSGIAVAAAMVAARADVPLPTIQKGRGDQCVEPTEVMRRDHMKFLLHQRDLTVHQGIRTTQHSLVECIDCHAKRDEQGAYVPVNAPDQFCQACHAYSGVRIDCFECHASKPLKNEASRRAAAPAIPVLAGDTPRRPEVAR